MIRVFGQELDLNKVTEFALLKVYGIGLTRSRQLCKYLSILNTRVKDLSPEYQNKIQDAVKYFKWTIDEDLRRQNALAQKIKDSINCWSAVRRRKGLPRNGQRTKSNSRTVRRVKG